MTLESLEALSDEHLRAVIARAGELLKQHERERKKKALADARMILATAGLSFKGMAGGRTRAAKGATVSGKSKHDERQKEL